MLGSVRQHELTDAAVTANALLLSEISERKQAEEALRRAQAQLTDRAGQLEELVSERTAELTATNKQLEAFVYSIAHDLRAPLRAMQGLTTMLAREAGAALSETGRGYADRIRKSAQFMDAMLIDLLAFSRIGQQNMELTAVSLQTVVESVLFRLQKDIQEKNAQVDSSGPWPVVMAHEPTLGQVLFNLVSNALKFTTPGVPPRVRLWTEEQAEYIRFWVEDNGPGIAADYHGQIFRLFTRLDGEKFEGTGIGLAIVQKGVERMGGRVGIVSSPGQGSRFWFELRSSR
jgi:signal transduction histidine kinase